MGYLKLKANEFGDKKYFKGEFINDINDNDG